MKPIPATKHDEKTCPSCGYIFDHASVISKSARSEPIPGDFTICLSCGQVLRFEDAGGMIVATDGDIALLDARDCEMIKLAQECCRKRGRIHL